MKINGCLSIRPDQILRAESLTKIISFGKYFIRRRWFLKEYLVVSFFLIIGAVTGAARVVQKRGIAELETDILSILLFLYL